jgi:trehalose 6-phosphate synthase/phosphatase
MVAEHGFYTRMTDGEWQPALQMDERWKPLVHEIFERCTAQVPLSSVEEKHSALAWHYRASDMAIAEPVARQAVKLLEVMGGTFPITVVPGHQVIEAHIRGIDKGTAARRFLDNAADKPWDFILAAGDDTTDEDLFKALPEGAFTVKVGEGESRAMSHVSTPTEMRQLLQSL